MNLQENTLADLDLMSRSHKTLPSTIYITWHMHALAKFEAATSNDLEDDHLQNKKKY